MNINVDQDRVELVLGKLVEVCRTGGYPYSRKDAMVPQHPDNLPNEFKNPAIRDPLAYSRWLWCLCYYMRGTIRSVSAARGLTKLYDAHPELFVPELAAKVDPDDVEKFCTEAGLGYNVKEIKYFWGENAKRLADHYSGDPRQIFAGVGNYDEACRRVQNDFKGGGFLGFQKKMVSMIIYYLMYENLIEFFYHPVPVDIHVARIFVSNELIVFPDLADDDNRLSDEMLDQIRQIVVDYAIRHEVNPLLLCNALWLLSSTLCRIYPGNATSVSDETTGRGRSITLLPVTWSKSQLIRYQRSCGSCPLDGTCVARIPSSYYNVWGQLIVIKPRLKPNHL